MTDDDETRDEELTMVQLGQLWAIVGREAATANRLAQDVLRAIRAMDQPNTKQGESS